MDRPRPVVFFDLGGTLGTPVFDPHSNRLIGLDLYPYVYRTLAALRDEGWLLGVICHTTEQDTQDTMRQVLERSGIYSCFDPTLLVYSSVVGHRKDSPEIFKIAVVSAGFASCPEECIFVGEDAAERPFAEEAGMRSMESRAFWRTLK